MKFRKKPVIIEAEQYRDHMRVSGNLPKGVYIVPWRELGDMPTVHTIHDGQSVIIEDGDWIIPEPDGVHFYPCKPDIFAATYEPVNEGLLGIFGQVQGGAICSGTPLSIICEHPGCQETKGVQDYKPAASDHKSNDEGDLSPAEQSDWEGEPVALCPAHAGTRQPAYINCTTPT